MHLDSKNLAETFAVLKPDLSVDPVAVTPELYADLDANYAGFAGEPEGRYARRTDLGSSTFWLRIQLDSGLP